MEESQAGVRAPIVAMKSRNGDGAKGAQGGGSVTDQTVETKPAGVPATARQAGEKRARWAWVEPAVWTARMLAALENGAKGGCLICAILAEHGLFSQPQPMQRSANPLDGQTTDWRARCGRSARRGSEGGGSEPNRSSLPLLPAVTKGGL